MFPPVSFRLLVGWLGERFVGLLVGWFVGLLVGRSVGWSTELISTTFGWRMGLSLDLTSLTFSGNNILI